MSSTSCDGNACCVRCAASLQQRSNFKTLRSCGPTFAHPSGQAIILPDTTAYARTCKAYWHSIQAATTSTAARVDRFRSAWCLGSIACGPPNKGHSTTRPAAMTAHGCHCMLSDSSKKPRIKSGCCLTLCAADSSVTAFPGPAADEGCSHYSSRNEPSRFSSASNAGHGPSQKRTSLEKLV